MKLAECPSPLEEDWMNHRAVEEDARRKLLTRALFKICGIHDRKCDIVHDFLKK